MSSNKEITAKQVKALREMTGAGMMHCKQALKDADGNIDKAIDILRKKGVAKAATKLDRDAKEGIICSYIHPGDKIGVLLELNCETDFVAKTDDFKLLAKELTLQIAANSPIAISPDDIPSEIEEKEKLLYQEQAKASGKPEQIVQKIVEGKLSKWHEEVCLLEQVWIKDQEKKIKDLITEYIAKLGENIKVKRFARYHIGEA